MTKASILSLVGLLSVSGSMVACSSPEPAQEPVHTARRPPPPPPEAPPAQTCIPFDPTRPDKAAQLDDMCTGKVCMFTAKEQTLLNRAARSPNAELVAEAEDIRAKRKAQVDAHCAKTP